MRGYDLWDLGMTFWTNRQLWRWAILGDKNRGPINSSPPGQNNRHFADDIFKCFFLNENVWNSSKISLKFVPKKFQLTIFQYWFRWWLGMDLATIHHLNPWWLDYWRIYTLLGLNELTHWSLGDLGTILKCKYESCFTDWYLQIFLLWLPPVLTDDKSSLE